MFVILSSLSFHLSSQITNEKTNKQTEAKPVFDHSYLSFGDGKYRCPGQFFAYFELGLVLSLFLSRCELSFVDGSAGVPDIERRNLVGVLKPSHDILVNVRKRDLSSC